jgi:hypothetical protein
VELNSTHIDKFIEHALQHGRRKVAGIPERKAKPAKPASIVAMSISGHRSASMFARYNVTDDNTSDTSPESSELQRCSSQPGFDKTGEAAITTTETVH